MDIFSATRLFKLIHYNDYGDATSFYDIKILRECTVREFIEEVLSDKREWGKIYVRCLIGQNIWFDQPKIEYSHGVIDRSVLPEFPLDRKVIGGEANGGWGSMSYWLDLEDHYV